MDVSKLSEIELQLLFAGMGGLIGFLSSIGTVLVSRIIEQQGKIKIHYKIVFSKYGNHHTWGFRSNRNEMIFEVPLWVELQNTSNVVRVMRDFNILLFCEGKQIGQMVQTNKIGAGDNEEILGNEGSYSFVLAPRSIKKYDLHFSIKQNEINISFDEIRLSYYDENDRKHIFPMEVIKECWREGDLDREGKWKLAQKHRKIRTRVLKNERQEV